MIATCPTCHGSRRVQRSINRSWWEVLLLRPSTADELCPQCVGTGLVALEGIADQGVLAEIARTDSDPAVRKEAGKKSVEYVGKLTDQTALGDIARTDSDVTLRKIAIKQLTDQGALAEISKTDTNWEVRLAAAAKLIDLSIVQEVHAEIAKTESNSHRRPGAKHELTLRGGANCPPRTTCTFRR